MTDFEKNRDMSEHESNEMTDRDNAANWLADVMALFDDVFAKSDKPDKPCTIAFALEVYVANRAAEQLTVTGEQIPILTLREWHLDLIEQNRKRIISVLEDAYNLKASDVPAIDFRALHNLIAANWPQYSCPNYNAYTDSPFPENNN